MINWKIPNNCNQYFACSCWNDQWCGEMWSKYIIYWVQRKGNMIVGACKLLFSLFFPWMELEKFCVGPSRLKTKVAARRDSLPEMCLRKGQMKNINQCCKLFNLIYKNLPNCCNENHFIGRCLANLCLCLMWTFQIDQNPIFLNNLFTKILALNK